MQFKRNNQKVAPSETLSLHENVTILKERLHEQKKVKKKRPSTSDMFTNDESTDNDEFYYSNEGSRDNSNRDNTDSSESCSQDENNTFLSKALIKAIKNDRNGAIVNSGELETVSVGKIDQYDTKRYRYLEVKSKLVPKKNIRVKIDYPIAKHIPKDILVPGNKYHILDAKVFNLSRNTPSWITIRAGRVQIHKTAKGYLSYKKFCRNSKKNRNNETKRKKKRRKYNVSSSSSCSR